MTLLSSPDSPYDYGHGLASGRGNVTWQQGSGEGHGLYTHGGAAVGRGARTGAGDVVSIWHAIDRVENDE